MASEYSVNIRLNTAQVKKDLKTIGTEISNLGKKETKSSKTALSTTDKKLKVETQIATLQKRTQAIRNSILRLDLSGVNVSKIKSKLTRADNQADARKFDLSKKNIALALKELEILKEQTIEMGKQTKARAGNTFKFPMGPSSPLNFGPGGQLLPGSGRGMFGTTRGFDFQSALISGGFPLLFGQGPVGAVAGGLGGGVGGMFGQMGGFAGGIAATAALQSITTTLNAIRDLGNALAKPTENIQLLTEKFGLANTPTGDLAARLEKLGLTSSASALLLEKFTEITGKTPMEIERIASELNEFNSEMTQFALKMQLVVAEVFTPLISLVNKLPLDTLLKLAALKVDPAGTIAKGIGSILPQGIKSGFNNTLRGVAPFLFPNQGNQTTDPNEAKLTKLAEQTEFTRNILPLQQQLDIEKQRFSLNSKEINVKKERNKLDLQSKELDLLKEQAAIKTNDALDLKIEKLTAEVALQQQIFENAKRLADPIEAQTIQLDQQMRVLLDRGSQVVALSQTISSSFEQAFNGLISGTMSAQDAFRNMLNSIANHFRETAAKILANQLQRSLLGILGNALGGAFNFGSSFKNFGNVPVGTSSQFVMPTGGSVSFPMFANGGRPPVGRASIVGERGPELFVPDRAGTIVPNNAMGGSTNIVINVDASGSSVEGDEGQANQFGNALASAIQAELINQKRAGGLLSNQ